MSAADPSVHPAEVFAALGDPTRIALLRAVWQGPRTVSDLAESLPVTRQAVSKHLRVLEGAGLLRPERAGREIRWHGVPEGMREARAFLDDMAAGWDDALERLAAHVEGEE